MERFTHKPTRDEIVAQFIERFPMQHDRLGLVVIPGSKNNETFGDCSDLDVTTIMKPGGDPLKVDISQMLVLAEQMRIWANNISAQTGVVPVVVSSFRQEECQIQMAKMMKENKGKKVLPIHWLFHPSVEFLAANEQPHLARGILTGKVLLGDRDNTLRGLEDCEPNQVKCLQGVDLVTDSLRVLMANSDIEGKSTRQPVEFLKMNASHNLHWFWKWLVIVPHVISITGSENTSWPEALNFIKQNNPQLAELFSRIHTTRHKGETAEVREIVQQHIETFQHIPL